MSRAGNAIRDLAYAPVSYLDEARRQSVQAVARLEEELGYLEAENERLREEVARLEPVIDKSARGEG